MTTKPPSTCCTDHLVTTDQVRKLYRPHDTHLAHEEARCRPYTCLFWSEEVASCSCSCSCF